MGDPGNPTDPSGAPGPGPEPDPDQPGWASPQPPPPATPPTPPGGTPPPAPPPAPVQQPVPAPAAWPPASPPAAPPGGPVPPPPPGTAVPAAAGGWTGATPPKKRSLLWLWLLIPTLVVLVASVIVAAVFAVRLVVGPIEATNDYFQALKDARYVAAYNSRCQSFRNQVSVDQFVSQERRAGPVRSFDITDFDTNGDTAETDGTVLRAGFSYDVKVHLVREDGDWHVCNLEASRR